MAPSEVVEVVDKMSDEEFKRYALDLIGRELGAYGLARFLRLSGTGSGNYTEDRRDWQDGLTVQDVIAQLDLR